ncbi:MAG: hypothetical protein NTY37_07615 [Methanothrix sp.]|nr:hypothetical protein [Methanothrix sp.]
MSYSHRDFAPSRDTLDLARSCKGREAMIADLKHYPVMIVLLQLHHP